MGGAEAITEGRWDLVLVVPGMEAREEMSGAGVGLFFAIYVLL